MPRLGHDDLPTDRPPIASAYSASNQQQLSPPKMLMMLLGLFVLKNVFFHDYRSEEIGILKDLGQTDDQIQQLIPKTASERRRKAEDTIDEFEQMKTDISLLKKEVKSLRAALENNDQKSAKKAAQERIQNESAASEETEQ